MEFCLRLCLRLHAAAAFRMQSIDDFGNSSLLILLTLLQWKIHLNVLFTEKCWRYFTFKRNFCVSKISMISRISKNIDLIYHGNVWSCLLSFYHRIMEPCKYKNNLWCVQICVFYGIALHFWSKMLIACCVAIWAKYCILMYVSYSVNYLIV